MSSTNKTENLLLNCWAGSDIPQMEDFNEDNRKIDEALTAHKKDGNVHLSFEDKERLNMPYQIGVYMGTGEASIQIRTNCPFEPSFGLVIPINDYMVKVDFTNKYLYQSVGFFCSRGGSPNISFSDGVITAKSSAMVNPTTNRANMNYAGCTYIYILFR